MAYIKFVIFGLSFIFSTLAYYSVVRQKYVSSIVQFLHSKIALSNDGPQNVLIIAAISVASLRTSPVHMMGHKIHFV